jgi:tartrate-resistant acid phosphatase type 5
MEYDASGNHDREGDDYIMQLNYSQVDTRWQMHSVYYNKAFADNLVEIFFLDTTTLCPRESFQLTGLVLKEAEKEAQYAWLQERLAASTAHWKIACGHYPVYSEGENGSTGELQRLELLMQSYNVDAYICGHDHSLQHLYSPQSNIHHLVCGTGSSVRYFRQRDRCPHSMWRLLVGGYLHMTADEDSLRIAFTNISGKVEHEYTIVK